MTDTQAPCDTIVLVHGLWMTPRSWEGWKAHFEEKGYPVLTPAYPGFEIEVEELRANPEIIAKLTVPETVDYLASVIESVEVPPIIMGHSFGGTLTQLLLARGLGAAGRRRGLRADRRGAGQPAVTGQVAVPGAEEPGQPAQGGRLHRGGVPLRVHQHARRARSPTRSGSATPLPAPGNWVWVYGLIANFKPGHQDTWVDYEADRAPLLFIGGEKDHIMPPSVNKSNAKHYKKSSAVTEYHEFHGRDHWTCAAPGWEAVADYALDWALAYADTKPRGRHTA